MKATLKINTEYLRNDTQFSLAPKGQESNLEFGKCNYFTDRKEGASPQYIVQTYSVGSMDSVVNKMVLPAGGDVTQLRGPGVSVHYVIDKDGTIYQFVPDAKRPWAAGTGDLIKASKLNPSIDNIKNAMNDWCIEIMSINNGKESLTQEQLEANIHLTSCLVEKHGIDSAKVIGLGDWAPGRHIAPGPYFPWKGLADEGLGLWSKVERVKDPEVIVSWKSGNKLLPEEKENMAADLQEVNKKFGYADLQEQFNKLGMVGVPNQSDADQEASALISSALVFNLHHLGEEILGSSHYSVAFEALHANSGDPNARAVLGEWTTNSQAVIHDILDS